MITGLLSNNEFSFIESSLFSNNGMSVQEYENLKQKHPYAIMQDDNLLILSSIKHYGLHDKTFNSFLLEKFGKPEYDIDFFYELIYSEGDYTNPHYDKKISVQTTLVLLSENFIGGNLIIDGKNIGLNKRGKYINFNGNKNLHEVTMVTNGQRRVLVIMFNNKERVI